MSMWLLNFRSGIVHENDLGNLPYVMPGTVILLSLPALASSMSHSTASAPDRRDKSWGPSHDAVVLISRSMFI